MPRGRAGLTAAVAGALVALALPRTSFWVLGWIGLVPLFLAWNSASRARCAAGSGLAAGAAYHAVVLHWIYATCTFARIPAPAAAAAWAALAGFLGLTWALTGWLGHHLTARTTRVVRPFVWAIVWTAVAAAGQNWTPRLAVDLMTYTQGPNRALLQAGSWGGPHLVGFLIVLFNAALAEAWRDSSDPGALNESAVPLSAAIALTALVWAHGALVLLNRPVDEGPTARVEILQPAIDQYRKWDANAVKDILDDFADLLSRPRPKPPALVVWPETSIPRWSSRGRAAPEAALAAKALGSTHLVGVIARPENGLGSANGVQTVDPNGAVTNFYAKRELVPFGEYVPLRNLIPRFVIDHWLAVLDQLGDMSAGARDQALARTPFGATAVTICYEAAFPRWARRDAARGSRLLINVTNDGWYKDTWGPYQHYALNSLRAIENREWTIRSGNTGISAVIDPWGFARAELALNERGRLDAEVPLNDPFPNRSFFARHGDWLGTLCLGLTALLLLRRAAARA